MNFSLPKELDYTRTIGSDRGSHQETQVITPLTGNTTYSGANQDTIIFQIPRGGADTVFDPKSSYLRFRVNNTSTSYTWAFKNSTVDSIFGRLETRHGPNTLEIINNYEGIVSAIFDSSVDPSDRGACFAIERGSISASILSSQIAAAGTQYFCTSLLSGVVGTLSRNYIPTFALNGNLEFRLQLNLPAKALSQITAGAAAGCLYTVDNLEFHANYIRLHPEIIASISVPVYDIHTESFSQFGSAVAQNQTTVEQVVPVRVNSLKGLFVVPRSNNALTNSSYCGRSTWNIIDYTFKVGSSQFPPVRVKCQSSSYTEPLMELKKCLHTMGTANTLGLHNATTWVVQEGTAANATGGSFLLGQDFDSYAGKSGELLHGFSTTNNDVYFSATYATGGISVAGTNDFYAMYDCILHIENGMMTAQY